MDDVKRFIKQGLAKSKEIEGRAREVLSVLSPDEPVDLSTRGAHEAFDDGSQYILIPGGKYIYSVTEKEVSIPDLWFARYPVTNRQYRSFIDFLSGTPSALVNSLTLKAYKEALHELANSGDKTVKGLDSYLKEEHDLVQRFRSEYDDDRKFNKDEQPVVSLTWFGAKAYCLWLSMLSGTECRLPTEEEWEWVAGGRREEPSRVLKVKKYPWGDKPEPTPKHANYELSKLLCGILICL